MGHNKGTDVRMKGVRRSPSCLIPFLCILFSGLHAGIGIGNALITYLETFIDVVIEQISHEEFQLRHDRTTTEECIQCLRDLKAVWSKSPAGGKALAKKRNRVKRLDLELKLDLEDSVKDLKKIEKKELQLAIEGLVSTRDSYSKEIAVLDKSLKEVKENLVKFTRSRRGLEGTVYTDVDAIFKRMGAS